MPGYVSDRASDRLLHVLRHPPVVLGFEVADRDDARAGPHGEFGFRGGPAHARGGAVDAQKNESGLPALRAGFPDVCVAVCERSVRSLATSHVFLDVRQSFDVHLENM